MRMPLLKLTRNCAEKIWVATVIGRDVRHASVAQDTAEVEVNLLMFLEVRPLKGPRGRAGLEQGRRMVQQEEGGSGWVVKRRGG